MESNFINFPEQFFEVVFLIKKLGSISYYIVNLHEKINDNFEVNKVMHEDEKQKVIKFWTKIYLIKNLKN